MDHPDPPDYAGDLLDAFTTGRGRAPERVADLVVNPEITDEGFVVFGTEDDTARSSLRNTLDTGTIGPLTVEFVPDGPAVFAFFDDTNWFFNRTFMAATANEFGVWNFALAWVWMRTEDLLDAEAVIGSTGGLWDSDPETHRGEDMLADGLDRNKLQDVVKGLHESEPVVPATTIEFDRNGHIRDYQEGRHRAAAADRLDIPWVNVLLAVNRKKSDGWTPSS